MEHNGSSENKLTALGAQIRDAGEYSARNSSKGALIPEAEKAFNALKNGVPIEKTRSEALDGTLFRQRSRHTRERIWDSLHWRYLAHRISWVIEAFKETYSSFGSHSPEFLSMLFLHYILRDRLTFDFVTSTIWTKWSSGQREVSKEDVLSLLDVASTEQPQIQRWAESSRIKLSQSILSALRDFGLLEGVQKKIIVKPVLPLYTAEHILRIITTEGNRGAGVLRDITWRLFLCTEMDVADILVKLSQERRIRFERTGNTVVLETPEEWRIVQ